ncbi:MAG: exodeoxyribonuclease VII small subunit [Bacteroidales bacterium]|nr:exodeoxyribonuclease VII small subunit [Candidatus Sodaliphilus fimicaballi]
MEENNTMTYTQAVTELEELVKKMQDPECSIDNLSEYTKRAKELLDYCRAKLTATDQELKSILDSLQS